VTRGTPAGVDLWHHWGVPERPSPIRLRYRLGPSDVVRALELRTACPGLIAVLGWAVSAGALALVAERNGSHDWVVLGLLCLGAGLAMLVVAVPACAAWRWHRACGFFAPHELTLDEGGVDLARGSCSAKLGWSSIHCWRESSQQFLLYQSRAGFLVVPKHAFASAAELSAFKQTLESHLGPAGKRAAEAEGVGGERWHASR
jgi:hypothetical protein